MVGDCAQLRAEMDAMRELAALSRVHVLDLEDSVVSRGVFGSATPDLPEIFRNLNRPEDYEQWAKES